MHYVEVWVADISYRGKEALTYCSSVPLKEGQVVHVPLRRKLVLGAVCAKVKRPSFAVKPVHTVLPAVLSHHSLGLLRWIIDYYAASAGVATSLLLPKSWPKRLHPTAFAGSPTNKVLPGLTSDQSDALGQISAPGTYILHGETGTGKTRIYIELAKQCLSRNQSSLILTPEIGLTSQLAQAFRAVFGERVVVIHSQLTNVTRQRLWAALAAQQEPVIIIGARSALFSPLKNIGLIVLDEAHETAYKQDQAPYYHASRVAAKLSALHEAILVLGSATPLVQDYYLALQKGRPIIRMQKVATAADSHNHTQDIQVVDLRDKTNFSRKSFLSDTLIAEISTTLSNKEQSLIFLNRRGTARLIFCDQCTWQAICDHCDIPMVYHNDTHKIRCHGCGLQAPTPTQCRECNNTSIVFSSVGTKAVVEEIHKLFPDARIMRFDTDNKKSERIETHYDRLYNGEIDIIVGTQTLAKGLDLPKLGLVGVVIADTGLSLPDFSTQERTYQLLHQVIGRVGRGHRPGRVVIQTYNTNSKLIKEVIQKDWESFYKNEVQERKLFNFPPFCHILTLACRRATPQDAQQAAQKLADTLRKTHKNSLVEGPAPAFHEKIAGKYQWQLVVKSTRRDNLLTIIHQLPSGWTYDIDPLSLL